MEEIFFIQVPAFIWYGEVTPREARAISIIYHDLLEEFFPEAAVHYTDGQWVRVDGIPEFDLEPGLQHDLNVLLERAVDILMHHYDEAMAEADDVWMDWYEGRLTGITGEEDEQ
jgi:hypothetical protein